MNKIKPNSFKKTYIVFLTILTIITVLFISFILTFEMMTSQEVIKISLIFIVLIFLLGIIFVYVIRNKILRVFEILDDMLDLAINEEKIIKTYDETILSSLESKLFKYIKVTKSNKESVEIERNKVKSLVADISHQTKTPISNILLYSQLLLENEEVSDYKKEILFDIKNQSERLNFLIQSLIKMSRLESGIILPSKNKENLNKTIIQAVQEVYLNAQQKEIDVSVKCEESITASIDNKWTKEALVNILENAIKYTHKGGNISINVTSYEIFQKIDITDNGIGIEENEINNIFQRFYRCKNSRKCEGVGIGLYLSRQIISLQGGYIKVSSRFGEGSTFSVFVLS